MTYPVCIEWIPGLPQNPYRIGSYEGVVMHQTANPRSTARSERSYELNNYQNAFVHEFIDAIEIIQVANPAYGAYGAGKYANQRFVHLELCNAKTQKEFERSFDMWCERAAHFLYCRRLGVTNAQSNGVGTLWGHHQVTKYLGGTDHNDPIAYLAEWGRTWEHVLATVHVKYKEMENMDELLKRVSELEEKVKVLENTAAPDWFIQEFGAGCLNGIVNDPVGDKNFWRNVAVSIRVVNAIQKQKVV
jgi:hypothetical protein